MSRQRPAAIRWFERLAYFSLVLTAVNTFIVYAELSALPRDASRPGPGAVFILLFLALAFYLPLIPLAARRASNLARWALVGLLCIHLLNLLNLRAILDYGGPSMVIALVQFPLSALLILLLLRADSRTWFAGDRGADPEVFR